MRIERAKQTALPDTTTEDANDERKTGIIVKPQKKGTVGVEVTVGTGNTGIQSCLIFLNRKNTLRREERIQDEDSALIRYFYLSNKKKRKRIRQSQQKMAVENPNMAWPQS